MGLFSTLFGTPKVIDTISDTVKSGMQMLDDKKFTPEELSKATLAYSQTWLEIQKTIVGENTIRSVTRRILAWAIMGLFLFLVFFSCFLFKFDSEWSIYIKNTIEETQLGWLTTGVGTFYFGYYGLSKIVNGKK